MTAEQIKNQMAITNTLNFMAIQIQRMIAHADIVGQGEQALEMDMLRIHVDKLGIIAEETLTNLRNVLDNEEIPAVVLYDADGNELDSIDKAV